MMDLTLDCEQSRVLSCSSCDPQKMMLRNCNGAFGEKSRSPILVNGNVYRICPRSIVANDWELGYLISLFFECKENKTTPFGGNLLETTAFCKTIFDFMESIVSAFKERKQKELEAKQKKDALNSKISNSRKK